MKHIFFLQRYPGFKDWNKVNELWLYSSGAVVEWLERLAVVQKVAGSSPARVEWLKNSHCSPSSECMEWIADSLQGRLKAAKGEDWAPPFTCRAQDTMGL